MMNISFFNQSVIKKIFAFFALIVIAFYFYFGFQGFNVMKIWNSFYQSDFYINYEGGFVRRGLDGQIIYELSKITSMNAIWIQKTYNLLFFLIFAALAGYFIVKYRPPFFSVFSTSILLLFVFYLGRGIRKDHILLVFFLLSCFEIVRRKNKTLAFISVNLLSITASLIHELYFIVSFFPIVLLLKNFIFEKDQLSEYLRSALVLLPSTLVFMIIFFLGLGNSDQQQAILASWKQMGVENILFNSGIFNRSLYIWELGFTRNQYISFLAAIALHFVFMIIMISNDLKNRKLKINFYLLIVLQYGVLLLLSIVAKDFSRWVFLCNFTTLIPVYILKKKSRYMSSESENSFLFFKKIYWLPYILFFINTMPHSGWSFNDYVVYNPVNLVYKIITKKPIF
ncbi:hypothetical protein [Chryseobacterium sp.]|uniref:hypothetical protein n=1 Tax=Chryseobacterium sp. TaxID=1871047 RepID=UPI002FCC8E79